MSLLTFRKGLEGVFDSGIVKGDFVIAFHSGEPLTVDLGFYEEAILIIKELNTTPYRAVPYIQTNGINLSESWCRFFKQHSFEISVSIDGPQFLHDHHRTTKNNKPTHALTLAGIELLQEFNIRFTTISVITNYTLDYPIEFLKFFLEHNIGHIGLSLEDSLIKPSTLFEKADNLSRYKRFIDKIYKAYMPVRNRINIREFDLFEQRIFHNNGAFERNAQTYPFHILSLGVTGDVFTFSPELHGISSKKYGKFTLGNINEVTLSEMLSSDKFKTIYEDILRGVVRCKASCKYYDVCGGGVPSSKYFENGTFDSTITQHCLFRFQSAFDIVKRNIFEQIRSY